MRNLFVNALTMAPCLIIYLKPTMDGNMGANSVMTTQVTNAFTGMEVTVEIILRLDMTT